MSYTMSLIALLFCLGIGVEAKAQPNPSPEKALTRMDRDGDNRIARAEWLGPPPAFGRIDTNSDEFLDIGELENWFGRTDASAESQDVKDRESSPFLFVDEIKMLMVGATVSHVPRGVAKRNRSSMAFHADGSITKTAANGQVGEGKWWTMGQQVLCHQYFGIADDSKACVLLQRKGNRVYHFNPKTRKRLPSDPWTIDEAGPETHRVRGG